MKQKMSPRGAIEFFEERGSSLNQCQRNFSRGDKWKFFYRNNYKEFQVHMQSIFLSLNLMTLIEQENFVSNLVKQSYANTSCFHHTFDLQEV